MISYTTEVSLHRNLIKLYFIILYFIKLYFIKLYVIKLYFIKLYLLCCSGGRVPGQAVRVREEETPDRERVQKPRHSGKTGVSTTPEMLEI